MIIDRLLCVIIIYTILTINFNNYNIVLSKNASYNIPKITYIMDYDLYHGRLNPSINNTIVNMLFNIHNINASNSMSSISNIVPDFDVFGWCSHSKLISIIKALNFKPHGYIPTDHKLIHKLRNKQGFKYFMNEIGLGDYVPIKYTDSTAKYPCIIKIPSLGEFGRGVMIVNNEEHLEHIKTIIVRNHHYMLEESLNGMGFNEGIALGSVYKGELISMRCGVHSHSKEDLTKSSAYNNGLYIRGIKITKSNFHLTPCSKELVNVIKILFIKIGDYTGAFCADFKADNNYNIKILEINPRNCHTHAYDDGIFISSFVPLTFKILTNNNNNNDLLYQSGSIYNNILDIEKRVLETGGGSGYWEDVDKFNHTKVITEYGYRDDLGIPKVLPKLTHD